MIKFLVAVAEKAVSQSPAVQQHKTYVEALSEHIAKLKNKAIEGV
jgi:hypothetical protein